MTKQLNDSYLYWRLNYYSSHHHRQHQASEILSIPPQTYLPLSQEGENVFPIVKLTKGTKQLSYLTLYC